MSGDILIAYLSQANHNIKVPGLSLVLENFLLCFQIQRKLVVVSNVFQMIKLQVIFQTEIYFLILHELITCKVATHPR